MKITPERLAEIEKAAKTFTPGRTMIDSEDLTRLVAAAKREAGQAAEIERLRDAINWALGSNGDFRPREPGEGPYWWRKELSARTAADAARAQKGEEDAD